MELIVAISVLPALYAWVNIYANGDPYVNTGNIQIAVASNDPGLDLEDGTHVNMADEVFEELKESTSIDWQFPDTPDEAINGVRSGDYYAAIVFEDNFTYNMYNFEQALLDDQAPLTYYENAKKNAVASKITETAASTLQESINTKYLETVFSIVYDKTGEVTEELSKDGEDTADTIIGQLKQFQNTLDSYNSAIDAFTGNSAKVQGALAGTKKNLKSTRASSKKDVQNAQNNINKAQKSVAVLRKALDKRLDELDKSLVKLEKILTKLSDAAQVTEKDRKAAEEQVADARTKLENLRAMLPQDGSMAQADTLIVTIDDMLSDLEDIGKAIDETPDRVQDMLAAIEAVRTLYSGVLKPGFDTLLSNMDETIAMLGPFIDNVSDMLDDVYPVIDATSTTVESMDDSMDHLQNVLSSASDRIGDIIAQVEAAENNDRTDLLLDLLGGDSDLYGKFFSSLADVETEEIYSVASYGAGMAPFYSVLAIWVGGVILVSILKTDVDRKKFPGLSEAQYYFGRFILFFLIGQLQAAVIVAGDIFLLDCQPVHPWRMWLAAAIASMVFVMLIYSLTLAFGDVGKAIVVVVMVVQIAGSSGSYPIEILPEIFSKIYRFFPFPYAINAIREALCGMYGNDYYVFLGELMLFAVAAVIIGLVVRRPFIGVTRFMSEKLEETEVL